MDARNLTAIPHSDAGSLEVIVPDGDAAIRWSSHGYPSSLAKALSSTNRNSSYP